jgi:hypothetical protein
MGATFRCPRAPDWLVNSLSMLDASDAVTGRHGGSVTVDRTPVDRGSANPPSPIITALHSLRGLAFADLDPARRLAIPRHGLDEADAKCLFSGTA